MPSNRLRPRLSVLVAKSTGELVMSVMEVVMANTDQTTRIWDAESRQEIAPLRL